MLLQLCDPDGRCGFLPAGEAVEIRALQVERGETASAYRPTSGPLADDVVPGDGDNMVAGSDDLQATLGLGAAAVERIAHWDAPGAYRLAATGGPSEHLGFVTGLRVRPGPHTVSVEVKPTRHAILRLQLLDAGANGVLGDFDLAARTALPTRIGRGTCLDAAIRPGRNGWLQVSLTATLEDGPGRRAAATSRPSAAARLCAAGERLAIRGLQVERGETASAWRPMRTPTRSSLATDAMAGSPRMSPDRLGRAATGSFRRGLTA